MSTIRLEYNHLIKAISDLGSLNESNKWWRSFLGYIPVGIMISIFSIGLKKEINPDGKGKIAFWGLFI
jgi:hypothetical membrane protein